MNVTVANELGNTEKALRYTLETEEDTSRKKSCRRTNDRCEGLARFKDLKLARILFRKER